MGKPSLSTPSSDPLRVDILSCSEGLTAELLGNTDDAAKHVRVTWDAKVVAGEKSVRLKVAVGDHARPS